MPLYKASIRIDGLDLHTAVQGLESLGFEVLRAVDQSKTRIPEPVDKYVEASVELTTPSLSAAISHIRDCSYVPLAVWAIASPTIPVKEDA